MKWFLALAVFLVVVAISAAVELWHKKHGPDRT